MSEYLELSPYAINTVDTLLTSCAVNTINTLLTTNTLLTPY